MAGSGLARGVHEALQGHSGGARGRPHCGAAPPGGCQLSCSDSREVLLSRLVYASFVAIVA